MNPIDSLPARLAEDLDGNFEDLVLAVRDGLYSGALRLTGHPSDAEDITQEALLRAYGALSGYPPERIREMQLRRWVWTIAVNLCRNRSRRRNRKPESSLEGVAVTDGTPGPEERAMSSSVGDSLAAHLSRLSWPMRSAVVLRHVVGLRYGEIADALDRPKGTVKADVHRGLARLRTMVEEEDLS